MAEQLDQTGVIVRLGEHTLHQVRGLKLVSQRHQRQLDQVRSVARR